MTDWNNDPNLNQDWATRDNAIKSRDESNARMDYTGDTNIPDGTIRWSSATQRFEIWDATTQTWSELSTEYAINVAQLKGAQPDVSATPDTIAKRDSTGKLTTAGLTVKNDASGNARIIITNAQGRNAEIIKRNDNGQAELRSQDQNGNLTAYWGAGENGLLNGWSTGATRMAYSPGPGRWEFYRSAGDFSNSTFARYISWKSAEVETAKTCYVDQINGDDPTAEPENSNKPFKTITAAINSVPRGGAVDIRLKNDYVLTNDEFIRDRNVAFYLDGYRIETQWFQDGSYARCYRFETFGSEVYFWIDTRNGRRDEFRIPPRPAGLDTLPLHPTYSCLFRAYIRSPSTFSFSIRADNTSTNPPIYVGAGGFIDTYAWSNDAPSYIGIVIGCHYGNAPIGASIVLDNSTSTPYFAKLRNTPCGVTVNGSLGTNRVFEDQNGNKITHKDAFAVSGTDTINRAARSINYYFSDGSHPGNTWGECGNVIIYDTAGVYTYTPTSGIRGIVVTLIGGGGGGAGATDDLSTNRYIMSGGSGSCGGSCRLWIPAKLLASSAPLTVIVGDGGTGGTGGNIATVTSGSDGGVTTLQDASNNVLVSVFGGIGASPGRYYGANTGPVFSSAPTNPEIIVLAEGRRQSHEGQMAYMPSTISGVFRIKGGVAVPSSLSVPNGYGTLGRSGRGGHIVYDSSTGAATPYDGLSGSPGGVLIEEYF